MAFVQKGTLVNQGSGSSSMTASITGVTAGNLLVATVNWGTTSTTDTAPSATGWSIAKTSLVSTSHGYSVYTTIYYKENAASGSHSLALSFSAGDTLGNAIIAEFSGYLTVSSLDSAACNTANFGVGSDATSGSISTATTTAQANELIVFIFAWDDANGVSNVGLTTPSGYNNLFSVVNSSSFNPALAAYREVTSTGTQTVSQSGLTAGWGSATIVAFKSASVGGSNTITGSNATQAVASSTSTTTQNQQTSGSNVSQTEASSTGSITKAVSVTGSNVSQASLSGTGSTMPSVSLVASAVTQTEASSTGALVQTPNVQAGTNTQSATSGTGTSTQTQQSAASNATQTGTSGTGSVVAGAAASIVSTTNIKQVWQSGVDWSAKTVAVSQAGDAIIALGLYYVAGTLGQKYPPTDNNGTFVLGVDQGRPDPGSYPSYPQPVLSTIYYQLNAAVGSHTITPPNIGPAVNDDGNIWVVVARGIKTSSAVRATGNFHSVSSSSSTTYSNVSVSLSSSCQVGDIIFAILGYDNDRSFGTVVFTDPNGWTKIASETDAATNCPAAVYWKVATAADTETVTLAWNDPHATVVDASIIAFAPVPGATSLTGSNATQSTGSSTSTISSAANISSASSTQAALAAAGIISAAIGISGSNTGQVVQSSVGAASAVLGLSSAASGQLEASSSGTVSSVQSLALASVQVNPAASASGVTSTQSLGASSSTQAGSVSTGLLLFGVSCAGQSVSGVALSSTGGVTLSYTLSTQNATGASSSSTPAISSSYNLAGSTSIVVSVADTGVVFAGTLIQLSALSATNLASTSSASTSQVAVIAASQSVGAGSSSVANMTQTYAPTALNAEQSSVVITGLVSLGVVVPVDISKLSFFISTTRHKVKLVQR